MISQSQPVSTKSTADPTVPPVESRVQGQLDCYRYKLENQGLKVKFDRKLNDLGWAVWWTDEITRAVWYAWAPPGLAGHVYFADPDHTPEDVKQRAVHHEPYNKHVAAPVPVPQPLPIPILPPVRVPLIVPA